MSFKSFIMYQHTYIGGCHNFVVCVCVCVCVQGITHTAGLYIWTYLLT